MDGVKSFGQVANASQNDPIMSTVSFQLAVLAPPNTGGPFWNT